MEFMLLFPLMFAIAYGGVVYSYVYVLQQSINFAAQQGIQAAVSVIPSTDASGTAQNRLSSATTAANNTLKWLPASQFALVSIPTSPGNCKVTSGTFTFEVDFRPSTLFPTVTLPLAGTFPPVPVTLYACAVAYT
ncbi:MAG TPA: TadE family protein [Nevskia sp.]|nr:TadE family protein [Nevskia sp.]